MQKIGDIIHGRDLGKTGVQEPRKYIFAECPICHVQRWLVLRQLNTGGYSRCQSCCGKDIGNTWLPHGRGKDSPHWKGGRAVQYQGYIVAWISEDSPYYPMATHKRRGGGSIFEHRLVIAQSINRCLSRREHVHHINGIKSDNRIENLQLISPANHDLYNKMCVQCPLQKQVRLLKKEIKELRAQLPKML